MAQIAKLDEGALRSVPEPERPEEASESLWNIAFEYGSCPAGTRISMSKAREIAADLLRQVAEAEKREIYRAFKREERRSEEIGRQYTEMSERWMDAAGEVARLKIRRRKCKR